MTRPPAAQASGELGSAGPSSSSWWWSSATRLAGRPSPPRHQTPGSAYPQPPFPPPPSPLRFPPPTPSPPGSSHWTQAPGRRPSRGAVRYGWGSGPRVLQTSPWRPPHHPLAQPLAARYQPGRDPARRRSGCAVVALVLGAVVTAFVVLIGVVAVAVEGTTGSATGPGTTSAPAPTQPAPTATEPESDPEPDPPTAEDRRDEARQLVRDNPIYAERLPERQRCADVDPAVLNTASRRAWARATVQDCLMPMYAATYRDAFGESLPAPPIEVIGAREATSPCGTHTITDNEAFYCNGNQTIYLWSLNIAENPRQIALSHLVIGHEFGHHVQYSAEITTARRYLAEVERREEEMLRRSELQAECLAGQFLRAVLPDQSGVDPGFPDVLEYNADSTTHGAATSRKRWITQGYADTRVEACNTFDVSGVEVR